MSQDPHNEGQSPKPEELVGDDRTPVGTGAAAPASDFWNAEIRPGAGQLSSQSLAFSTTLRTRDFFKISLFNGLLNIVTLTLYRFWGKTEVRRRVWRGVRLNDEAFEYTGRGKELFIGFLLASLLLGVPFLAFVFAVQFLDPAFASLLIPLYLFIFWLWGFGMFTAYRYMASRTTWRGIRFVLFGSAPTYGFMWMGLQIANSFTGGWIQPVFERLLAEQVWKNLRFGDRPFRWNQARSESIGLYGPFALGWFGTFGFIIVAVLALVGLAASNSELLGELATQTQAETASKAAPGPVPWSFVLAIYGIILLALPIIALIWAPYQAAVLRSISAGVSLDDARFDLEAGALSLWWLTCTNIAAIFLSLGLLMPMVQARTAKYLVQRLRANGTANLDEAHQAPPGPKTAEGLADAFGFSLI